jgi:hypothetical protein
MSSIAITIAKESRNCYDTVTITVNCIENENVKNKNYINVFPFILTSFHQIDWWQVAINLKQLIFTVFFSA